MLRLFYPGGIELVRQFFGFRSFRKKYELENLNIRDFNEEIVEKLCKPKGLVSTVVVSSLPKPLF